MASGARGTRLNCNSTTGEGPSCSWPERGALLNRGGLRPLWGRVCTKKCCEHVLRLAGNRECQALPWAWFAIHNAGLGQHRLSARGQQQQQQQLGPHGGALVTWSVL